MASTSFHSMVFENGKYNAADNSEMRQNEESVTRPKYHYQFSNMKKPKFNESDRDEISIVLSIVYGVLIVILAIVFKVTESVTDQSHLASKQFQILLFCIGLVWFIAYKLYNVWLEKKSLTQEPVKSPHASNRWLKGVVALFGIAIIIKDILEVIGTVEIDNPNCDKHAVFFSNFILHAFFIMGQVVLLFFCAKVHIQEIKCVSRFGIMHILASNLAVWVSVIADETSHALHLKAMNSHNSKEEDQMSQWRYSSNYTEFVESIESQCNNSNTLLNYLDKSDVYSKDYSYHKKGGLFSGKCSCHTTVCTVIGRAEKFLTPLLVEYCLVSSCLLYVMWSHIGKDARHHAPVARPSHKFYKSYKGVVMGALMLIGTVIVMTLLGTLDSGIDSSMKSYYTESQYLVIYDSFLLAFNITVLIACVLGFYVYSIAKLKRRDSSVTLDIVLLFICVTGPLLVGIFSALGLSAGANETKAPGWVVSLFSAIVDVIVSIVQILFAIHGLNKEPGTHNEGTNSHKEERKGGFVIHNSSANANATQQNHSHLPGIERTETSLADPAEAHNSQGVSNAAAVVETESEMPDPPAMVLNHHKEAVSVSRSTWSSYDLGSKSFASAYPAKIRIVIRDIMIFLVMCNTCLYVFLSLSHGTVFSVYFYANEYFGHSAWTTLASVTAPFSIFLKLHFAACFFEIWAYS